MTQSELAALETAAAFLLNEINDIQAQLGDRDKLGPDGKRMNDVEYHQWRKRAAWALKCKTAEYREMKAQIKEARRQMHRLAVAAVEDLDPEASPLELLAAVFAVTRRHIARFNIPVDAAEQRVINCAEAALCAAGLPEGGQ